MYSSNFFDGMDLNTEEKKICRKEPIAAIQKYRARTGSGLKDAKDALDAELGISFGAYGPVKERLAFSLFFKHKSYEFNEKVEDTMSAVHYDLKEWRQFKMSDEPWAKKLVNYFYDLADEIIKLDNLIFDKDDPRNADV